MEVRQVVILDSLTLCLYLVVLRDNSHRIILNHLTLRKSWFQYLVFVDPPLELSELLKVRFPLLGRARRDANELTGGCQHSMDL